MAGLNGEYFTAYFQCEPSIVPRFSCSRKRQAKFADNIERSQG